MTQKMCRKEDSNMWEWEDADEVCMMILDKGAVYVAYSS